MSFIRLSLPVFCACIFWISSLNYAHSQTDTEIQPYFRSIELPIAVAVVHGTGSVIGPEFFEALVGADAGGFLRHEQRARSFSDANAVVFIIDTWAEVASLPFQQQLSYVYEPVSALPETVSGFGTRLIATDGTQIGIVFVAERFLPEDALACGVQVFYRSLVVGFDGGELGFIENTQTC